MEKFEANDTQTYVSQRLSSPVLTLLTLAVRSGLVVSMFTAGAFFGAALAGPTGDYLGRRVTIIVGSVVFCLGGALQTGAQSISYLWAGRFLAGLGYKSHIPRNVVV